jgi:CysZ protein
VALLALIWVGLEKLLTAWLVLPYPWLVTILSFLSGIGLIIGLAFLLTPASFVVAGLFLDELAEVVEGEVDPLGPKGRALPIGQALWIGAKFAGVSLIVNLIALLLLLVPGVNAVAFFGANAYLLGRGYFELAALRYRPLAEVGYLRRAHAFEIFIAGLCMAALLAIPVANLLTPLFGTALMVRIHKQITRRQLSGYQTAR